MTQADALVELDIFSGMPNPEWSLSAADAQRLADRLGSLPPAQPRTLEGNLGYRGFIVHLRQGAHTQVVHVQKGVVHVARDGSTRYASDEHRRLEKWLLETGRAHLKTDLFEMVEREIG